MMLVVIISSSEKVDDIIFDRSHKYWNIKDVKAEQKDPDGETKY
jgi:hypothetical protein